ncbi:hypothetical protein D3C76_1524050 [compost metagenome]
MGKRKPSERKTIKGGPYGEYVQYFLTDEELAKYRNMSPDEYWETNSKPIRPPEYQNNQRKKKNGA